MVSRLQPHLGDVYDVEKPVGLCFHWARAPALCGVDLVVDLVLAALESGGADCCGFAMDGEDPTSWPLIRRSRC
jgi:hypothetical protein